MLRSTMRRKRTALRHYRVSLQTGQNVTRSGKPLQGSRCEIEATPSAEK